MLTFLMRKLQWLAHEQQGSWSITRFFVHTNDIRVGFSEVPMCPVRRSNF